MRRGQSPGRRPGPGAALPGAGAASRRCADAAGTARRHGAAGRRSRRPRRPHGERGDRLAVQRGCLASRPVAEVGEGAAHVQLVELAPELRRLPGRGRRVEVHELGRVGVLVHPLPHGVDDLVQRVAIGRSIVGADRGDDIVDGGQHLRDRRAVQILLAGEVVVDRRHGDIGGGGHVADRGVDEAALAEHRDRGVDDLVASRGSMRRRLRHHRPILPESPEGDLLFAAMAAGGRR